MNVFIFLYLLIISPKLLWDYVRRGKRHPALLQRWGFNIPKLSGRVIWIHAVSVGEIKAALPLFQALKAKEEETVFLITTTTATGQEEAKRSFQGAHHFAYLPIDLSFVVRRFVKQVNPAIFILVESDFWPNLLQALKKQGTRIVLVSGKLSVRSFQRLQFFHRFAKTLFAPFDLILAQNEEQKLRLAPFVDPSRLLLGGNLKLSYIPRLASPLQVPQPAITISCTHHPEEMLLLDALYGGPWYILLAPRHPERFKEVKQLLEERKIPHCLWSEQNRNGNVLLIDTMGQLPSCYLASKLTIVGGSYIPKIGGHNILEPIFYHCPVFFGPHMEAQTELVQLATHSKAGKMVLLNELRNAVATFLSTPEHSRFQESTQRLTPLNRTQLDRLAMLCLEKEKNILE